ncbi:MAG: hypothetical protein JO316_00335 [Abitibacteriaceae bacterium]|nr:hypothetical protein [Abditibacteriaceae bacterium]MBV9863773.1 hypothetical protein [Abditibacteriaceae bacterium]
MRFQRNSIIGVALLSACGAIGLRARVTAAPVQRAVSTSPSVRHAARLKYYPPPGWIRHYLGDDRYKIDGNIWRVVSTQMDTYYHRPNCPNMLRQSHDIVLGFASGEDAVEAGYRPDPVCHPEEPVVEYAGSLPTMPGMNMSVSGVAQTVTLADGSSMTLPANWVRVTTLARQGNGASISFDIFKPARGTGTVTVGSMTFPTLPNNANLEHILTPEGFRSSLQGNNSVFNTSGVVNSTFNNAGNIVNNVSVSAANIGSLRGVLLRPKPGKTLPGLRGSAILAARGQKMYIIQDNTNGAPGVNTIMRSFRPR